MNYFLVLCGLLLVRAVVIGVAIASGQLGLSPDEAQYWTWSQALDWGYYSKPPGIAWAIALTTSLFGNSEFGIRAWALLVGSALPLVLFALARQCELSPRMAFFSALLFALSPLGVLSSWLATTDGSFALFGSVAILLMVMNRPIWGGVALSVGALFKWPLYLLWAVSALFCRWRGVFVGIAISLVALLPSIYWNMTHEWATFRHVGTAIQGGGTKGNPLEFIGAQAALASPIFFVAMLMALWQLFRQRQTVSRGLLFCGAVTAVWLGGCVFLSFSQKMQGNWAVFAYPTGAILAGWWLSGRLEKSSLAVAALFSMVIFFAPVIPYKMNPFRHMLGWNTLPKVLEKQDFLFGDKYQSASLLSFYGGQRAYFLNIHGVRHNQFSYWPSMKDEQLGKTGLFVWLADIRDNPDPSRYLRELAPYFEEVTFVGSYPLFLQVKMAICFRCRGYNGKEPPPVLAF